MIYKHYWVLISIYARARDRMARDAARQRRTERVKEDNAAVRGEDGGATGGGQVDAARRGLQINRSEQIMNDIFVAPA